MLSVLTTIKFKDFKEVLLLLLLLLSRRRRNKNNLLKERSSGVSSNPNPASYQLRDLGWASSYTYSSYKKNIIVPITKEAGRIKRDIACRGQHNIGISHARPSGQGPLPRPTETAKPSSNLLISCRCTKPGAFKTRMLTKWSPPGQEALVIPFKVPERLLPSLCSTQSLLVNSYRFLQLHLVVCV